MDTVEHPIIHYIKFSRFSQGRTNSRKLHVVKMDRGDSPHSSSANMLIAAAVQWLQRKTSFSNLHLYEHLKLRRLWNNWITILLFFLWTKKVRNTSYTCLISRCELLMVTHWVYHTSGNHISKYTCIRVFLFLSWMSKFYTLQLLTQPSSKKTVMIPWMCRFSKRENYM